MSLVKSSVVPDGTARADRTMVAQEVLDTLAEAAPLAPLKVQLSARLATAFLMLGLGVTAGDGAATTATAPSRAAWRKETMAKQKTYGRTRALTAD